MARSMDKIHHVGMSPENSMYLTVDSAPGPDGQELRIEPPLHVVFEGDQGAVAFTQHGLAARYTEVELSLIGEGNPVVGMRRVIGDIAVSGSLEYGNTKPLHPDLIDGKIVTQRAITA